MPALHRRVALPGTGVRDVMFVIFCMAITYLWIRTIHYWADRHHEHHPPTVVINADDEVWITFSAPWHDLASWIWYFLSAGEKTWITLHKENGSRVLTRAVKMSDSWIKLGGK